MAPLVLDRRVALEQADSTPDGAGGFDTTWVALGMLWARIDARTGTERGLNGATLSGVTYRITVRSAPYGAPSRPKPDQRFRDGARIFRITGVAENDDGGHYLTCFAIEEVAA